MCLSEPWKVRMCPHTDLGYRSSHGSQQRVLWKEVAWLIFFFSFEKQPTGCQSLKMRDILVIFVVPATKYLTRSNVKMKEKENSPSQKGCSCLCCQSREKQTLVPLNPAPTPFRSELPVHGSVPPHVYVGLPSLVRHPHQHTQKCIS